MNDLQFDVVGAAGPRRFFSRLTNETIGHAYLFSGPEGVGKKTFARRLAQSLLCEAQKPGVLGYDATCRSCALIGKEETRHPDLLESLGALKIGDDASSGFHEADVTARDVVRQLSLEPYFGRYRVFVFGDVGFASPDAANALLKFFEEPPRNVVLLLTSATPERLLPTIRSRFVDVRFPALTSDEVREVLLRRSVEAGRAQTAAALSQGSVTRALAYLDDDESGLRSQVAEWFFAAAVGSVPEGSWASRDTLDEGLEIVKTLARDWTAISAAGSDATILAVDYRARLLQLPKLEAARTTAVLSKLSEAQRLASTNVSPSLTADFVRMSLAP